MSRVAVRAFIENVLQKEALQEKWNAADGIAELVALAVEQGHEVDEEDMKWAISALQQLQKGELSDEELAQVAGGAALPGDMFTAATLDIKSLDIGSSFLKLPKLF